MFLKPTMPVIPTEDHSYPAWHKGREKYALWYIEVTQPELLNYLHELRSTFSGFLFTPNSRQFHITLWICGFLNNRPVQWNDDFDISEIDVHTAILDSLSLSKFSLRIGPINSFDTALFIEVHDETNVLTKIRSSLSSVTREIAPLSYCPHITLGLYKEAFDSNLILDRIRTFPQQTFEFEVSELTLGFYQATVLQGPLYHYHTYSLRQK